MFINAHITNITCITNRTCITNITNRTHQPIMEKSYKTSCGLCHQGGRCYTTDSKRPPVLCGDCPLGTAGEWEGEYHRCERCMECRRKFYQTDRNVTRLCMGCRGRMAEDIPPRVCMVCDRNGCINCAWYGFPCRNCEAECMGCLGK